MDESTKNSKVNPIPKPVKTVEEAVKRYGPIQNGKWGGEDEWMVVYRTPQWFADSVLNRASDGPCAKIYMNKDMVPAIELALKLVEERGLKGEIKFFDGAWMIRSVRGVPGSTSTHSFGLALDFNGQENPLGGPNAFSPELVACFKDAGFTWGGDFKRLDPMHFSLAWE